MNGQVAWFCCTITSMLFVGYLSWQEYNFLLPELCFNYCLCCVLSVFVGVWGDQQEVRESWIKLLDGWIKLWLSFLVTIRLSLNFKCFLWDACIDVVRPWWYGCHESLWCIGAEVGLMVKCWRGWRISPFSLQAMFLDMLVYPVVYLAYICLPQSVGEFYILLDFQGWFCPWHST